MLEISLHFTLDNLLLMLQLLYQFEFSLLCYKQCTLLEFSLHYGKLDNLLINVAAVVPGVGHPTDVVQEAAVVADQKLLWRQDWSLLCMARVLHTSEWRMMLIYDLTV